MLIDELDYELPEELIAQHPPERRDAARMLAVDRSSPSLQAFQDSQFSAFPSLVRPGDVVVINNTRVFPARLYGRRVPLRGRVELFLIQEREQNVWETLARPARRLNVGERIDFGDGRLMAEVIENLPDGRRALRFHTDESLEQVIEELGRMPLPPYIKRDDGASSDEDRERYQTVFAQRKGAIAAPTAGLHFTEHVLDELRANGALVVEITLHVGYGTFEPVRVSDLEDHKVAPERYEIGPEAAESINKARESGGRIIAIGTTTTRALESSADDDGRVIPAVGFADLTITPGYKFRVVDSILTNFHLPRSSLLALVASFAGLELTLAAYRHAVEVQYRFYSYGDCMLII